MAWGGAGVGWGGGALGWRWVDPSAGIVVVMEWAQKKDGSGRGVGGGCGA